MNDEEKIEVTLLMPCLDEEETIGDCIDESRIWLEKVCGQDQYEILISDNGSTDASVGIAKKHGARIVRATPKGYGHALRVGIREARGKFVIMVDSDLSYDPSCIPSMLSQLKTGSELVIGNRFDGGIEEGAMPFLHQYLGNPALSFIGRLFSRLGIRDFHCGMRGFLKEKIESLGLQCGGMEFASEMIVRAGLVGLSISEVPVRLRKDGRRRRPHLRTWSDGWRHLRFLLLYSPTWLFSVPGSLMMIGGVGLGLFVLSGSASFSGGWGRAVLDLNSLVYAAVFVAGGFHLVSMGALVNILAKKRGILPQGRKSLFERLFLEWGIFFGGLLVILGILGTVALWWSWSQWGFIAANPQSVLRIGVPSATALTLGIQMGINSFLVGVAELTKDR